MTTNYHIQLTGTKARIQQPGYREVTCGLDEINMMITASDNRERTFVLRKAREMLNKVPGSSFLAPHFLMKKGVFPRK